ncbi:MAG: signal peptidase I [Verrucomicrobiota bacterium]
MVKDLAESQIDRIWKRLRLPLLTIASTILFIRLCVADWSFIFSGSMNPTIYEGEMVLTNKLAYDFQIPLTPIKIPRSDPQHGDIVVFRSPEGNANLVKRVVGVPGDTVEMVHNMIYINGKPRGYELLPARYSVHVPKRHRENSLFYREISGTCSHRIMVTPGTPPQLSNIPATRIPEGQYFLLGDNRSFSRDSRMYGFVARDNFIGRADKVLLSFAGKSISQPRKDRLLTKLE